MGALEGFEDDGLSGVGAALGHTVEPEKEKTVVDDAKLEPGQMCDGSTDDVERGPWGPGQPPILRPSLSPMLTSVLGGLWALSSSRLARAAEKY